MALEIKTMLDSIPNTRKDWREEWKEDAKADWKTDWLDTVAPLIPDNTVLPVVTGTPQVGQTLSLSNGTWTGTAPVFTYAWYVNGGLVAGATANTYVVQAADVGFNVVGRVIATNAQGTVTADAAAVGPVLP